MLPIRTILHPTDLSPNSQAAFGLACALARDYGARLLLLHVIEPPVVVYGEGVFQHPVGYEDRAAAELNKLPVPQGLTVERKLVEGEAASEIVSVAEASGADLICIGSHGRRGLSRLLMGSIAEQVMRKAPCPVMTVKPSQVKPAEAPREALTAQ
jgi:nucleotide-binding universal stress UspA family protein